MCLHIGCIYVGWFMPAWCIIKCKKVLFDIGK